ncbi:hypothetical protein J2T07_000438 [Luteibacter jiangsuensis]|uniref:Uncharacterized protein n=1 Tax=Luteibacter jiangsuensis TaxID=637577 RepID=A0ABT9STF7_9GAMM|nr:hypothetical protein [Luteibacter jiangsuensis]MDQ0008279.1 hypothetical protein [Luteibacter jiangsuensis]
MKIDHAAECRFFSAEDAIRFALSAYYAATKHIEPPAGEPWVIDGAPWASGADFADAFMQEVADRISAKACELQLRRSGSQIMGLWWPLDGDEITDTGKVFYVV